IATSAPTYINKATMPRLRFLKLKMEPSTLTLDALRPEGPLLLLSGDDFILGRDNRQTIIPITNRPRPIRRYGLTRASLDAFDSCKRARIKCAPKIGAIVVPMDPIP